MRQKIFIALAAILVITIWVSMGIGSINVNKEDCTTKRLKIKGVVTNVSPNQEHRVTTTDHPKPFRLSITSTVSNKGFPDDYIDLKEGDSLIKARDTNFVTQRRGNKIAVHELSCID